MSLVPRTHRDAPPVTRLRHEVDHLFDNFFRGFGDVPRRQESQDWSPTITVSETENAVKVRAELPGLDRKNIDISIDGDILTLSGEKRVDIKEENEKYLYVEHSQGSFMRKLQLPVSVDASKAEAVLTDGVLDLKLPKTAPEKSKSITIK